MSAILASTIKESSMLMLVIGMSLLYSYVMSYLHISQAAAQAIADLALPRWDLIAASLALVVVLGFFLPPVSVILMTAPILLPPIRAAGCDLVWFGVIMTLTMELGLIHPPVGLNLFVIKTVAPDLGLAEIVRGVLPFVALIILAVLALCVFPDLALWVPNKVYGLAS
jgi:TRAP-type C4-dicarboxylate transport system permease large subunit